MTFSRAERPAPLVTQDVEAHNPSGAWDYLVSNAGLERVAHFYTKELLLETRESGMRRYLNKALLRWSDAKLRPFEINAT